MTYTLISAAVLSSELAALPAGPTVAHALLAGLTAGTHDLAQLAAGSPNQHDGLLRARVEQLPQLRELKDHLTASSSLPEIAHQLRSSRIDGPAALDRLVRLEVLGPEFPSAQHVDPDVLQRAAAALIDAALRGWVIDDDTFDTGPRAGAIVFPGWQHGGVRTADMGIHGAAVLDVLQSLRFPATRSALQHVTPVAPSTWAAAMHQACWATHLSGRVREAAIAQLWGVLSLREAGMGGTTAALMVWQALSGMLQAIVVSDLLDEASLRVLLSPAYPPPVPSPTGDLTSSARSAPLATAAAPVTPSPPR